jgi:2-amino-4-hydroxy-6-hydroxymethyldihydropteridine diphosphokinase
VHDGQVEHREHAFVGLGANLGDAWATLARAVEALGALPHTRVTAVSRLYRTRPVGPVVQGDFLNAVVAADTAAGVDPAQGAMDLLIGLKRLERDFGRETRERWGPREIDLDLLLFGDHELHVARPPAAYSVDAARSGVQWLDVPHAAAAERLFVLAPLADVAATLEPPGWGRSVEAARARALAAEGEDAVTAIAEWDAVGHRWLGV